jgi:short-subunit dehydrogenase
MQSSTHHWRNIMKNSVAIVTGASQGIGRSTAIRLARDFSAVVLAARNGEALEAVADAVKAAGAEPVSCALDLSQFKHRRDSSTARWTVSAETVRS